MELEIFIAGLLVFGTIPALVFIGPLYVAHLRSKQFGLWKVLVVSALPGCILALFELPFGLLLIEIAVIMVLTIDGLSRLWPGLHR